MRGQDQGLAQEGLHHLSPGGRSTSEPCQKSIRETKKNNARVQDCPDITIFDSRFGLLSLVCTESSILLIFQGSNTPEIFTLNEFFVSDETVVWAMGSTLRSIQLMSFFIRFNNIFREADQLSSGLLGVPKQSVNEARTRSSCTS